jgi:hypothetical protein
MPMGWWRMHCGSGFLRPLGWCRRQAASCANFGPLVARDNDDVLVAGWWTGACNKEFGVLWAGNWAGEWGKAVSFGQK